VKRSKNGGLLRSAKLVTSTTLEGRGGRIAAVNDDRFSKASSIKKRKYNRIKFPKPRSEKEKGGENTTQVAGYSSPRHEMYSPDPEALEKSNVKTQRSYSQLEVGNT